MLKRVSILLLTAVASFPAYAHAGDHHFADLLASLVHFVSEPLHGGAALIAIFIILAIRSANKHRLRAAVRSHKR